MFHTSLTASPALLPSPLSPTPSSLLPGGHTAEMLAVLKRLSRDRFTPITYVLAESDSTSKKRVEMFEVRSVFAFPFPTLCLITLFLTTLLFQPLSLHANRNPSTTLLVPSLSFASRGVVRSVSLGSPPCLPQLTPSYSLSLPFFIIDLKWYVVCR